MATIDDINNVKPVAQPRTPEQLRQEYLERDAQEPVAQKPVSATQPRLTYADMVRQMSPYKPPTSEELEQERRKQKRDTILAAIGDGFAAFNQAYANARGVKPIASVGMSAKVRDRYERLKKERDAKQNEYMNAYMKAMQADDALGQQKVTNLLAQRRQDRLDRETKIKEDKALSYMEYQKAATSKNEEMAAFWRARWEALEAGYDADVALKKAKAAQAEAAARLANVRADAGGFSNSNGAGMGEYTTTTTIKRNKKGQETGRTTTRKKGSSNSGGGLGWGAEGNGNDNDNETDW